MIPGGHHLYGYDVLLMYLDGQFNRGMIQVAICLPDGGYLEAEVEDKTPVEHLSAIVNTLLSVYEAQQQAYKQLNHYAKMN